MATLGRNRINAVAGQTFQRDLLPHILTGNLATCPSLYYLQVGNATERDHPYKLDLEAEHVIDIVLRSCPLRFR